MFSEEELEAVRSATPQQQANIYGYMQNEQDPAKLKDMVLGELGLQPAEPAKSINQSSVDAEAAILMGGDMAVGEAVAASGIGNQEQVRAAAAEFTRIASQAIQEGRPLSQVRFADPNLSVQAQAEIYEQVAQQSNTSSAAIEEKAKQSAEQDMQMLQKVFGASGKESGKDSGMGLLKEMGEVMDAVTGHDTTEKSLAANPMDPKFPWKDVPEMPLNGFVPGPGSPGIDQNLGLGFARV